MTFLTIPAMSKMTCHMSFLEQSSRQISQNSQTLKMTFLRFLACMPKNAGWIFIEKWPFFNKTQKMTQRVILLKSAKMTCPWVPPVQCALLCTCQKWHFCHFAKMTKKCPPNSLIKNDVFWPKVKKRQKCHFLRGRKKVSKTAFLPFFQNGKKMHAELSN